MESSCQNLALTLHADPQMLQYVRMFVYVCECDWFSVYSLSVCVSFRTESEAFKQR